MRWCSISTSNCSLKANEMGTGRWSPWIPQPFRPDGRRRPPFPPCHGAGSRKIQAWSLPPQSPRGNPRPLRFPRNAPDPAWSSFSMPLRQEPPKLEVRYFRPPYCSAIFRLNPGRGTQAGIHCWGRETCSGNSLPWLLYGEWGSTCQVMSVPISRKPAQSRGSWRRADRWSCDHPHGQVALKIALWTYYSHTHPLSLSRSFPNIPLLIAAKPQKRCITTNSIGRIQESIRSGLEHPISAYGHMQSSKYTVPRMFNTQYTTMRRMFPLMRRTFSLPCARKHDPDWTAHVQFYIMECR